MKRNVEKLFETLSIRFGFVKGPEGSQALFVEYIVNNSRITILVSFKPAKS